MDDRVSPGSEVTLMTTSAGDPTSEDASTLTDDAWWFGRSATAEPAVVAKADAQTESSDGGSRVVRLALGMAVMAAEKLGAGAPSERFLTGVGLLQQTALEAQQLTRQLTRRTAGRAGRLASRTADWASRHVPGAEIPRQSMIRSQQRFGRGLTEARRRGEATVTAGRADASAFLRTSISDSMRWAQNQAVPQFVDGLMPHLVDDVVPRLIDGVMPEIRSKVLPMVIEDLANDPHLRSVVREQSKGAAEEATQHLRTTSATADDRIEAAYRRLAHKPLADRPEAAVGEDSEPGAQPTNGGASPGSDTR
jgi:hypothetical protein